MKPKYFVIERYSHHFVIRDLSAAGIQIVNKFALEFVQYTMNGYGRFRRKELKAIYAAKVRPLNEYRFHHGQWELFKMHLISMKIDIDDVDVLVYGFNDAQPLNCNITTAKTPYDYQVKVIDYLVSKDPLPIKLVEIQTGKGKALPYDALLLTDKGFVSMGALNVGDFLIDPTGLRTMVKGKYPQPKTPMLEFVTEDGRIFECSDEHLWNAYDAPRSDPTLITAATMASTIKHSGEVYLKCWKQFDGISKIPEGLTSEFVTEHLSPTSTVYETAPHNLNFETVYLAVLSSMICCGMVKNGEFVADLRSHNNQKGFADFVWYLGGSLVPIEPGSYEYYVRTPYNKQMYTVLKDIWCDPLKDTDPALSYGDGVYLRVMDYEITPERETCCIEVDNDTREFIIDDYIPTHNTFCAMAAAVKLNRRIIMFLKPQFIEKWEGDCEELIGVSKDEVLTIQGSSSLMAAIADARSGQLDAKVIIISNRTFQNWIKEYEDAGNDLLDRGYGCVPHEICDVFKAGLRIVDEAHMDFHLNFKIDLYTHVEHSISLSATMISDDPFVKRMQDLAYPKFMRYAGLPYDKYVHSIAWCWSLANANMVQTTERGSNKYSHNAFEKSIIKNPKLLEAYLKMHDDILKRFHFNRAVEGDKCLLYFASIAMCTIVTEYLKRQYPNRDIRRYVESDPYENLMDAEIPVSTILSAGTGHDIGGLITVILSHSINSTSSNMQGYGRIRKIKDKRLLFVYTTCIDIPRQVDYYNKKEELLKNMALSCGKYDVVGQLG